MESPSQKQGAPGACSGVCVVVCGCLCVYSMGSCVCACVEEVGKGEERGESHTVLEQMGAVPPLGSGY